MPQCSCEGAARLGKQGNVPGALTSNCHLFLLIVYAFILEASQGRGGLKGVLASAILITCTIMCAWL